MIPLLLLEKFKIAFEENKLLKKIWLYKNKIIVLDFLITNNRIAFDILINNDTNNIECWVFSRNMPQSLESIKNRYMNINQNKIMIFEANIEDIELCINKIKLFLEKINLIKEEVTLEVLYKINQDYFANHVFVSRIWTYKNITSVLDFNIFGTNIAFSTKINKDTNNWYTAAWSRNNKEFFKKQFGEENIIVFDETKEDWQKRVSNIEKFLKKVSIPSNLLQYLYLSLKNEFKDAKIHFAKENLLVCDLTKDYFNLSFEIEENHRGLFLKLFGRNTHSKRFLENILKEDNFDIIKNRYQDKFLLGYRKDYTVYEEIEKIILDWMKRIDIRLNKSDKQELVNVVSSINDEVLERIKKKFRFGKAINIAFLVSERAKWNAQSLWEELKKDKNFSCKIYLDIHMSRGNTKEERWQIYKKELEFYSNIDSEIVCLYDKELDERLSFAEFEHDIVFYQQPWTLDVQLRRSIGKSLGIYMNYSLIVHLWAEGQYNLLGFFPFLWKYFSKSKLHKEVHLKYDPTIKKRIKLTGHPKLDIYLDPIPETCNIWKEPKNKIKIIYAPHFSIKSGINISTFHWNYSLFLELSKKYKEQTQWIYKPHPKLEHVVESKGVMSKEEYQKYQNTWASQNNTSFYNDGNYFDIFRTSDVLITDSGSFLLEYFPTGKPIIWLKSEKGIPLNEVGIALSKGFYIAKNKEDILSIFEDVIINKNDTLREIRENVIKDLFPFEKKSTTKVIDLLYSMLDMNY